MMSRRLCSNASCGCAGAAGCAVGAATCGGAADWGAELGWLCEEHAHAHSSNVRTRSDGRRSGLDMFQTGYRPGLPERSIPAARPR
jgi:hypothetical protein